MNNKTAVQTELDIHLMSPNEAKQYLLQYLSGLPRTITEVTVIHGYRGGTLLRRMIQNELHHPRIKAKYKSLNQGITILHLT